MSSRNNSTTARDVADLSKFVTDAIHSCRNATEGTTADNEYETGGRPAIVSGNGVSLTAFVAGVIRSCTNLQTSTIRDTGSRVTTLSNSRLGEGVIGAPAHGTAPSSTHIRIDAQMPPIEKPPVQATTHPRSPSPIMRPPTPPRLYTSSLLEGNPRIDEPDETPVPVTVGQLDMDTNDPEDIEMTENNAQPDNVEPQIFTTADTNDNAANLSTRTAHSPDKELPLPTESMPPMAAVDEGARPDPIVDEINSEVGDDSIPSQMLVDNAAEQVAGDILSPAQRIRTISAAEHFVPVGGSLKGITITTANVNVLRDIFHCIRGTYLSLNNHSPVLAACKSYSFLCEDEASARYEITTPRTEEQRNNATERRKYMNRKRSSVYRTRDQEYERAVHISIDWFAQLANDIHKRDANRDNMQQ